MKTKKIHQIWVGKRKLPPMKIMKSWQKYCEKYGWEYKLWTEEDIENLDLKNKYIYDFYKNCESGCNNYHGMSNIARLEIINRFGGFYFDCDFYSWGTDIESIVNLDHNMIILFPENKYPVDYTRENCRSWMMPFTGYFDSACFVCNGAFYANPNNNVLTDIIESLPEIFENNKNVILKNQNIPASKLSWMTTGCWQMSHFAKKYPIVLLSTKFIFSSIEYARELGMQVDKSSNKKFIDEIICSYIDNHNQERILDNE